MRRSTGQGRAGSVGRSVPLGAAACARRFSASVRTSQASPVRTIRASLSLRASGSSSLDVNPRTAPDAENTGPPALPIGRIRSDSMRRSSTLLTVPDAMPFSWRSGVPMVKTSCPVATAGLGSCPHASGTGLIDAATAASIRTTATSRIWSAASTAPVTLIAGESCTSIVVSFPMTRWFVTTSPFASARNPEPCVFAVQIVKTLSCHCGRRNDGSASTASAAAPAVGGDAVTALTSAFAAVSSSEASRPAAIWTTCVH